MVPIKKKSTVSKVTLPTHGKNTDVLTEGTLGTTKRINELIEQLGDNKKLITSELFVVMAELVTIGKPAVPALIETLKDDTKDGCIRAFAADVLTCMEDARAKLALLDMRDYGDEWGSKIAIVALRNAKENRDNIGSLAERIKSKTQ